ncbi:MAG: MotA/TolQ/ExbB proton channel family protein [SAR324 cluster bacterium]|nr:MotA/TolQ/ExbB proton channel family protein [SAR324 cluster bacterium]
MLLNIYNKGGIMMVPLALCSIIMIMLIVERALALRSSRLLPPRDLERLRTLISSKATPPNELNPSTAHPTGRILDYAVSVLPASAEHFKEALSDQARRERHYLERGLVVLEIIVGIAPLLGLLGTALGMIDVFNHLSLEGAGRADALSRGISEALITTVVGLCIGIPSLVAFNLFTRKIESIGLLIEEESMFFYYKLFGD